DAFSDHTLLVSSRRRHTRSVLPSPLISATASAQQSPRSSSISCSRNLGRLPSAKATVAIQRAAAANKNEDPAERRRLKCVINKRQSLIRVTTRREISAVNHDDRAGHETAGVRGKIDHRADNLVWLCNATDGSLGNDGLQEFLRGKHGCVEGRPKESRSNGIDADFIFAIFDGQCAGQLPHSALAGALVQR